MDIERFMVFPRIGRQHWWQMEHASLVLLLAAIFIGHVQFASSLELCDTGGVNIQEVPLCLVNFWVCFSNPNLFCAQMQGTSNDGDPSCSGE